MNDLLLDTGFFVALVSKRDRHREQAFNLLDSINSGRYTSVSTSDYVLAETWNFVRMKLKHISAAQGVHRLAFGSNGDPPLVSTVYRVHGPRFAAASEKFRHRFDLGLSFTDWTSVVVMQENHIDSIATFDQAFQGLVPNVVP